MDICRSFYDGWIGVGQSRGGLNERGRDYGGRHACFRSSFELDRDF